MAAKPARKKSVKDQGILSALSDDEKDKLIAAFIGELEGRKSSSGMHSKDADFVKFLKNLQKKNDQEKAKATKKSKQQQKRFVTSDFFDRWDIYAEPVDAVSSSEYSVSMALIKAPNTPDNAPVSLCLLIHLHEFSKTLRLRAIPDIFNAKNETLRKSYDCEITDADGALKMPARNPERRLLYPVDIEQKVKAGVINCNISGKIGNITLHYDYKNHVLEQFDYKDFEYLSEEKEGRRQKRPREDWPDPDKPRYASVNRMDIPLSTRIDACTAERLEIFIEESGKTKKGAIVEALNLLIDAYEQEQGLKFETSEPK